MSFLPFVKKASDTPVYLFDVGSGSVGGGIAILHQGKPRFLAVVREPISFHVQGDLQRLSEELLVTLNKVIERLEKVSRTTHVKRRPDRAHVTMASPWYASQTHIVRIQKDKPFEVTQKVMNRALKKAEEAFRKSADEDEQYGSSLVHIEQLIATIHLNGYATSMPYGKKATRMEAALFLSLMSGSLHSKLEKLLEEKLSVDEVSFHSFALASFTVARDLFPEEDDFMLLDVSGETADMGLVHDGILLESVSFPWGRNLLLREIALKLGTIPEEAHSLVRMELSGKRASGSHKAASVLSELEERWLSIFKDACESLSYKQQLPKRVYLTALPDIAPWFKRVIENDACSGYTFTNEPLEAVLIDGTVLTKYHTLAHGAMFDPFLALEGLFIARQSDEVL